MEDSIQLIKRYASGLEHYFGKVSNDRLVAMLVNPLLATYGCSDISALLEQEGDDLVKRARELLAKYIFDIARGMLQAQGKLYCSSLRYMLCLSFLILNLLLFRFVRQERQRRRRQQRRRRRRHARATHRS